MKNVKIIGLLLGTALLATACGGGGGSGGGSATVSKVQGRVNASISAYNAPYRQIAQEFGVTGAGSTITVIDDFNRSIIAGTDVTHGATVTAIASSIATGATITTKHIDLAASAGEVGPLPTPIEISGAINELLSSTTVEGNQVFNLSFGAASSRSSINAIARNVNSLNNNQVAVVAAGNESCVNTSTKSCNYIADVLDYANGDAADEASVIIVGAINGVNGGIASYSNRPGSVAGLQQDWIVADGYASTEDRNYKGTSFAAPKVAAGVTLVTEKYSVTAQQAAQVILDSANDDFTGYNPEIHGQGKFDLRASISPAGTVR